MKPTQTDEDLAVELMLRNHNKLEEVTSAYEGELRQVLGSLIALIIQHSANASYFNTAVGKRQLRLLYIRLTEIAEEYADDVTASLVEAYETSYKLYSTDDNEIATINYETGTSDTNSDIADELGIDELNVSFDKVVREAMTAINMAIRQNIASGAGLASSILTIEKVFKQLEFKLRRTVRTLTSTVTNQGLYDKAFSDKVEFLKWETRPEATPSGTCSECEGYANGGVNGTGIYPIDEMPSMPAHEHCACVAVRVLG